jgi:hypothetical protein
MSASCKLRKYHCEHILAAAWADQPPHTLAIVIALLVVTTTLCSSTPDHAENAAAGVSTQQQIA